VANSPAIPATKILDDAKSTIQTRVVEYDRNGARSMDLAVRIFNVTRGMELTEADGRLFMLCLKLARSMQGRVKLDTYVDLAGEVALLGECVLESRIEPIPPKPVELTPVETKP
jgi:hypothetical protein